MRTIKENIIYEIFILVLSVISIILISSTLFFEKGTEVFKIISTIDFVICIFFFFDFMIKLFSADSKIEYLKWGWIDLLSSIPMFDAGRIGRMFRIMKIIRILRAIRSSREIIQFVKRRKARSVFFIALINCLILITIGSLAILEFEGGESSNIKNAEDAIWWSFVTITTVGYGDYYPVTTGGRIVASILMLSGISLFGAYSGLMLKFFIEPNNDLSDE